MAGSEPICSTICDRTDLKNKIQAAYFQRIVGQNHHKSSEYDAAYNLIAQTGEMYPEKWIGRRP